MKLHLKYFRKPKIAPVQPEKTEYLKSQRAGYLKRGSRLLLYKKGKRGHIMEKVKVTVIAALSALMSWLGILAVPVFLLVGCNIIDYATGLCAAKYRSDKKISSYKSIRGIIKKVCMWLLVIIGSFMDILIQYAIDTAGIPLVVPFVVATVVAIWLVVNEIISILENMIDIGVTMPPFLIPIAKYIKKQVEEKANIYEEEQEEQEEQKEQEDTEDE